MASLAKVQIIGNVGRDPELRMTPSGRPVCEFSVAVNQKTGGEETTTWYRVSCWGRQAEIAQQYVEKGGLIFIDGRLSVREWTNKEGEKRTSIEVNCNDFQLLGAKRDREETAPAAAGGFDPDEIPF